MTWLSHTQSKSGRIGLLHEHLESVATTASAFAAKFGASDEARVAGLFHDLGKYSALFQKRLKGEVSGLDHWSIGAWAALTTYQSSAIAAVLAIQGHHIGLQNAQKGSLASLQPQRLKAGHPMGLRIPEEKEESLLDRLRGEVSRIPDSIATPLVRFHDFYAAPAQAMFSTRMLFSALVDADFIETEGHFQADTADEKRYRERGAQLNPEQSLADLLTHIDRLKHKRKSSSSQVDEVRSRLLQTCLSRGASPLGLYTLTAPTGAGKTLSSLAFALKHAISHDLERIIVVLPFLSLIEQTVAVYRSVFRDHQDTVVLEDHSLVAGDVDDEGSQRACQHARMMAENWDAPIVITTGVRFLESLFANRPSACRKLHNIANSVIIMDEVQTLPLKVTIPTLATLSHLATRFKSTVVFSTATQPAFDHLDEPVHKLSGSGWKPIEIVEDAPKLFDVMKRTSITVDTDPLEDWSELVQDALLNDQIMFVVNLKRHALALLSRLRDANREGLLHLSTNMCPGHRSHVLEEVRRRLDEQLSCCLISTQCVEAGVDIDFPTVYRAMAPLDGIIQAAGRCNRNGEAAVGRVHVFRPPADDKGLYPSSFYQQAASVTELVLKNRAATTIDVSDTSLYREYYETLYSFAKPEDIGRDLMEAIHSRDFEETAKFYRIIPQKTVSVLVPYDQQTYPVLAEQARSEGITREWIRKARGHSVGIYRTGSDDPRLEKVTVRFTQEEAKDWAILLDDASYDSMLGLTIGLSLKGEGKSSRENLLIA